MTLRERTLHVHTQSLFLISEQPELARTWRKTASHCRQQGEKGFA